MESESSINNKISDSGYSNSYSNSHSCSPSQTSRSASSKSRHSGSNSSRSSGYCGTINPYGSTRVDTGFSAPKRYKDKEHKKKKLKASADLKTTLANAISATAENEKNQDIFLAPTSDNDMQMAGEEANVSLVTDPLIPTLPSAIEAKRPMEDCKEMEVEQCNTEAKIELPAIIVDTLPKEDEMQLTSFEHFKHHERKEEEYIFDEPMSSITSQGPEVGFCCVISMYDGVVLYTSPSLTTVLGFPKDMWLGRSFIEFVHPKDRETFSTQVTSDVAVHLTDTNEKPKDIKTCLYVCLRKYKGLKSSGGTAMAEKVVSYQAFHLTITMKHIPEPMDTSAPGSNVGKYLVVVADPIQSSYKVPRERKVSAKFGMRHTTTCILNHVDPDVVTNLGFLPQDMVGKSVFDFYHPEDMPFLKEVYKSVMKMCQTDGLVYRSKPYRFLVQNGCFAMIETEWSSFINPWSRRLEFVISLHRVLQGPLNPDVFAASTDDEFKNIPMEAIRIGKNLQAEIVQILHEDRSRPTESAKQEVSKRCQDLASFIESLIKGVDQPNLQLELPKEPDVSISERDSAMLGEISPHHEYYDSKSSSETPPSYIQLNYNENIKRFFQSKPKTTVSDESNGIQNNEISDQEVKNSQECMNNQKVLSSENSGASGSGSGEMLSSGSNQNMDSGTTSGATSNDSYKPPPLTASILVKHNEDMEKLMAKEHKELRHDKRGSNKNGKYRQDNFNNNNEHAHGVKRSGGAIRMEGDHHKVSKHQRHCDDIPQGFRRRNNRPSRPQCNAQNAGIFGNVGPIGNLKFAPNMNDMNVWPSYSVAPVTPLSTTRGAMTAQGMSGSCPPGGGSGNYPSAAPMVPVYYIPTVPQRTNFMEPIARYPVQYMPSVFYNTVFPSSLLCSPVPVVPVPLAPNPTVPVAPSDIRHLNNMTNLKINTCEPSRTETNEQGGESSMQTDHFCPMPNSVPAVRNDRPSSQATSVKAEPGSKMGSIASASVVNKALSESSRKAMGLQSVCSPDSPLVSPPDGETHFNAKTNENRDSGTVKMPAMRCGSTIDESSSCYSSSYSSFLRTDSGSNDDFNYNKTTKKTNDETWQDKNIQLTMRKKDPQWLESVAMSSDLIYRYQVAVQNIEEILEADLKKLKEIEQPVLVNDQLNQLYIDMELEGLSKALTLEEGFTSSSSSGEDNNMQPDPAASSKLKTKRRSYGSLMMIYEEEAPLPPPDQNQPILYQLPNQIG